MLTEGEGAENLADVICECSLSDQNYEKETTRNVKETGISTYEN